MEVYLEYNNSDNPIDKVIANLGIFKDLEKIDIEKILSEIIEENKEKIIAQKKEQKVY